MKCRGREAYERLNRVKEIAAKAVIYDKNRFLLLKQNVDSKIFFTLPGGRIRSGDLKAELANLRQD